MKMDNVQKIDSAYFAKFVLEKDTELEFQFKRNCVFKCIFVYQQFTRAPSIPLSITSLLAFRTVILRLLKRNNELNLFICNPNRQIYFTNYQVQTLIITVTVIKMQSSIILLRSLSLCYQYAQCIVKLVAFTRVVINTQVFRVARVTLRCASLITLI